MTECPKCEGEGVIREALPAKWEPIAGTYIPDEREVPCEACDGTGEVEEEE